MSQVTETDAPERVAVEFELTPEEWEAANAAHLSSSPLQVQLLRRTRRTTSILFAALAVLNLAMGSVTYAVLWALAGVFFAASLDRIHRSGQRKALRKLGEQGIANGIFGPHRVEVREEGLVDSTTHYEWLIRWSGIERVREENGTFLIYNGANAFLPIPSTAFPDSDSLRRFADAFYRRLALHGDGAAVRAEPGLPEPGTPLPDGRSPG